MTFCSLSAVVFDMDGVLVDTEPVSRRVLDEIFRRGGQRPSSDVLDSIIGVHVDAAIDLLSTAYPITLSADEIRAEYERTYLPQLGSCTVAAGVLDLLESAREQALPVGLASSASRAEIDIVLGTHGLASFFHVICSGDDVTRRKPDPEIYQMALRELGAEPGRSLAIEDSQYGVAAAVDAGMRCIAVRSNPVPGLDLSRADAVVDTLSGQSFESLWLATGKGRSAERRASAV